MSLINNCALCCMILSMWGAVQLTVMGVSYHFEVTTLLSDVEPKQYDNYDDFIKRTKKNYSTVSMNCFIAAAVYAVLIIVSYVTLKRARKKAAIEAKNRQDEEIICGPQDE